MKIFDIEEYATFGVVEYLQVENSFVVRESWIEVVSDESSPEGLPLVIVEGVVSVADESYSYAPMS